MIRKIALLIVMAMISSLFSIPVSADNSEVYIKFGKNTEQNGISATVNGAEYVMRDGKEAIVLNPDTSASDMYISMNGNFSDLTNGECVDLTVTYYDEGEGKFTLYYDGEKGKTAYPEIIRMENTCVWKEKTFRLQNPRFSDGADGADIRINLNNNFMSKSGGKVYISDIKAVMPDY